MTLLHYYSEVTWYLINASQITETQLFVQVCSGYQHQNSAWLTLCDLNSPGISLYKDSVMQKTSPWQWKTRSWYTMTPRSPRDWWLQIPSTWRTTVTMTWLVQHSSTIAGYFFIRAKKNDVSGGQLNIIGTQKVLCHIAKYFESWRPSG